MSKTAHVYKAADLLEVYITHNPVRGEDLEGLLERLSLKIISLTAESEETPTMEEVPPVPIEDSVSDDYLICLEDGERVKLLKRYLKKHFDMSPEEYREKWDLPEDYPMVTKNYSEMRRKIAKEQGLGRRPQ